MSNISGGFIKMIGIIVAWTALFVFAIAGIITGAVFFFAFISECVR